MSEIQDDFRQIVKVDIPRDYVNIFNRFSSYTMIPLERYVDNLALVAHFIEKSAGALVECGTWRGGMAAGMIEIAGMERSYHFFDSFEGLPPAQEIDGEKAIQFQKDTDHPGFHNNCTASIDVFNDLMKRLTVPQSQIHVYKGWFSETLSQYRGGQISVLRLDGDWYESTIECLDVLYPQVVTGGCVIIDDYDDYQGCSRAVHDYLSRTKSGSRISRTSLGRVPYLVKVD
jgi:O-methyltransferase